MVRTPSSRGDASEARISAPLLHLLARRAARRVPQCPPERPRAWFRPVLSPVPCLKPWTLAIWGRVAGGRFLQAGVTPC